MNCVQVVSLGKKSEKVCLTLEGQLFGSQSIGNDTSRISNDTCHHHLD